MQTLIAQFPQQLREAVQIGKNFKLATKPSAIAQVLVSGLGGSGIGASIVQEYVNNKLAIPFVVNKDYFIPKWTNPHTLFIACSYSGNTEETLQAVKDARKAKAQIVCVTSGGALAQFARKYQYPLIEIPSGMPPRACLGYSMVQILFVLQAFGLLKTSFAKEIVGAADVLDRKTRSIQTQARKMADGLYGKQIAVYTVSGMEALGIRFCQQLLENSKVLCWQNVVPEMTHNEIVGWRLNRPDIAAVFCQSPDTYERNSRRLAFLKKIVKQYKASTLDITLQGENHWEKVFQFIHLTDWVSVFLADRYGHDTVEVKVIDRLKAEMSKS
jgi:glucose/mannose-6-phosphate isomerase